jgi:hypothetical protein
MHISGLWNRGKGRRPLDRIYLTTATVTAQRLEGHDPPGGQATAGLIDDSDAKPVRFARNTSWVPPEGGSGSGSGTISSVPSSDECTVRQLVSADPTNSTSIELHR